MCLIKRAKTCVCLPRTALLLSVYECGEFKNPHYSRFQDNSEVLSVAVLRKDTPLTNVTVFFNCEQVTQN